MKHSLSTFSFRISTVSYLQDHGNILCYSLHKSNSFAFYILISSPYQCQFDSIPFIEILSFSPCHLCCRWVPIPAWFYFWAPVLCHWFLSILMPLPHCLNYCDFIIILDTSKANPPFCCPRKLSLTLLIFLLCACFLHNEFLLLKLYYFIIFSSLRFFLYLLVIIFSLFSAFL